MELGRAGAKRRAQRLALVFIGVLPLSGGLQAEPASGPVAAEPRHVDKVLAGGALWAADVPQNWNGTVLLNSHGYAPSIRAPETAGAAVKAWLLAHGYALVASSYSKPGWALAEAVPDQIAALDAFRAMFGPPKRTIAWGNSMGGLITIALIETHPERFEGGIAFCASAAGSLGMLNMALDGAFAFKTLAAPQSDIRLVGTLDDLANAAKAGAAVTAAQQTPQGRARLALAAVLADLPPWTDAKAPQPAADDDDVIESQAASAFVGGIFLPRSDQEARAGGVFSWNTGIDYRRQLEESGRRAHVEALYQKAGLDLETDLQVLAKAPRIAADPTAIAYMRAHYVPTGRLSRPLFSAHTIGDGATVPANQSAYADMVRQSGRGDMFADAWVARAGHCTFTAAEIIAALQTEESRIDNGKWSTAPMDLNRRAKGLGLGESAYIPYHPPPFLRPCTAGRACEGEGLRK